MSVVKSSRVAYTRALSSSVYREHLQRCNEILKGFDKETLKGRTSKDESLVKWDMGNVRDSPKRMAGNISE